MADPMTLGVLGIGASAAGSLVNAYGQYSAGQSQAAMYNYQAQIAKQNAEYQRKNAEYAGVAGEEQAMVSSMRSGAQLHHNRAIMGASGIAVDQGSSADVIASERKLGQIDTQTIRNNAARQVFGYQVEGAQAEAQSGVYKMAASTSQTAGNIGAAGSILSGVSSVSDKWIMGQTAGLYSKSTSSSFYG